MTMWSMLIRMEEFLPDCHYFALWSLDIVTSMASPNRILDILAHEWSLTYGASPSHLPSDQTLNASGYDFDGVCLLSSGVVHTGCTSFQKEEVQLEEILSVSVRMGSLELLTECIKHWKSENKAMHLSAPFHNYPLLQTCYTAQRQKLERLSRSSHSSAKERQMDNEAIKSSCSEVPLCLTVLLSNS
ncbi:protein ELYS-like isoform X1 [Cuculus canorus]|uniref:protein ELYS-like isoform X1 n=1 Tax=Cuculus canorus TaxID=55661 RepID=UPI0023AB20B7|nr:protein ELYS-like isoform X1 [Cuculus canorus]